MRLYFTGNTSDLSEGIEIVSKELGIEVSTEGQQVDVIKHTANRIEVRKQGNQVSIHYPKRIHFFRALGLLVEALRENEEFHLVEEPQFTMNGPMFDVSQGHAVIKVESIQRFLRIMALMGLDMIMLYAEDSYDVKEHPYFGYMRGRYTQEELKQMDDYAYNLGIEMIPCIQTLGHLKETLKWRNFADLRDDDDTLLVGYEKTYAFIEQMIVAASAPLRSKRIHIGMDEAWGLGLGKYLIKNGLRSKFDLMNEHLAKVMEITAKHELKPMMWSDMYFRAGSKTGQYYDPECVIPEEVIASMPEGVQQVYWDYDQADEGFYIDWIKRHKKLGSVPVFAGGIWNWKGFCLNYGATFLYTNSALPACKQEGVTEIIATLWGDDGTECDWFSALLGLQLYAEHGYAKQLDEEKLKQRFEFCTGARFADYMDIRYVDETPGVPVGNPGTFNTSRYLLWQNLLMGLFDRNIIGLALSQHYAELEKKMEIYTTRNGEFGFVFEVLRRLCAVLNLKAEMGIMITQAYHQGDKEKLRSIVHDQLPELSTRLEALHVYHRERWHKVNKPFGWEVIDLRYGALFMNIDNTTQRIEDFMDGRIERIEELEEQRLPFQGREGLMDCFTYKDMPSASRIVQIYHGEYSDMVDEDGLRG